MLLFESYTYLSPKGLYLKSNRRLFLTRKPIYHSYKGYAESQMKRIVNHNVWLNKFPDIHKFVETLRKAYESGIISEIWLKDYTSGSLLFHITGQKSNKGKRSEQDRVSVEEMSRLFDSNEDFSKYLYPKEYDYIFLRDLNASRIDKEDHMEFLSTEASYQVLSKDQFLVYEGGTGIFCPDGTVKMEQPKPKGPLKFIMTRDSGGFKADCSMMDNLYTWISQRNEKRAALEKDFGYDTKHASHCIRLLITGIELLRDLDYNPKLSSGNLSLIKDIRAGEFEYQKFIEFYNRKMIEFEETFNKSLMPNKIDNKKIRDLILDLRG